MTEPSTRITLFCAVDRRRYERSLLEARERAETAALAGHEAAQLREQFMAILGHDLRNPLAAIEAGTRLLSKEGLSPRGRLLLKEMGQSVARANLLVSNVLDFARGRLGEGLSLQRDARKPLAPVLEQIVAEVRSTVPDRQIVADFDIPHPVNCDRARIGQLAANLLSNAVAHGDPSAPIKMTARAAAGNLEISVENAGTPIPLKAQRQLFQPFFRGSVRRNAQGLGLGLYIVSEIAQAHGGQVSVASEATATRFTFTMSLT